MKKPSSGLAAGWWIALGLLLLYLGGAVLIVLDVGFFGGAIYRVLPQPVIEAIIVIYVPLWEVFQYFFPMKAYRT